MNMNVAWFKEQGLTREILGDYLNDPDSLPPNTVRLIRQKSDEKIQSAYDRWLD